jgi:hypothetical protein
MVYIVFAAIGVIAYVCHKIEDLKKYLASNSYYMVQIWNGSRHVGGMITPA